MTHYRRAPHRPPPGRARWALALVVVLALLTADLAVEFGCTIVGLFTLDRKDPCMDPLDITDPDRRTEGA